MSDRHPPRGLARLGQFFSGHDETQSTSHPASELIITRVRELESLELRDVMTPRVDVVYLTMPVTPEAIAEAVRDTGHSNFPVVGDDLDDVEGILFVKDLFRSATARRTLGTSLPGANEIARKVRRPPTLLPETMSVIEALEELRSQRRTFAIVIDEHGGVAGIVSTRDLLEPLVGDLTDEFDEAEDPEIARIHEGRWLIAGKAKVDEVRDTIGLPIPDGDFVTIAGFIMQFSGKVPVQGDVLTHEGWQFHIVSVEKRRIHEVVVRRLETPTEGDREEGSTE
jgi:CBS domain containing-hemolysin-like protein